jgi:DNA-binding MarR family transcriptional regulator
VQSTLALTAGNLDSHIARLEVAGYVLRGRALTSRGFQVHLKITPAGAAAFRTYLASLREYLGAAEGEGRPPEGAPAADDSRRS